MAEQIRAQGTGGLSARGALGSAQLPPALFTKRGGQRRGGNPKPPQRERANPLPPNHGWRKRVPAGTRDPRTTNEPSRVSCLGRAATRSPARSYPVSVGLQRRVTVMLADLVTLGAENPYSLITAVAVLAIGIVWRGTR